MTSDNQNIIIKVYLSVNTNAINLVWCSVTWHGRVYSHLFLSNYTLRQQFLITGKKLTLSPEVDKTLIYLEYVYLMQRMRVLIIQLVYNLPRKPCCACVWLVILCLCILIWGQ